MEQELNKPRSAWAEFGSWLTVPFFVVVGFMMLVGGVGTIRSGHIVGIVFGLFFVGMGLLLTVGVMAGTISVFVGWLRRRRDRLEEPAKAIRMTVAAEAPRIASPPPSAVAQAPKTPDASQPEMTPITWLAVISVLLGAALSLALRFQRTPADSGGRFFHVWASVVGAGVACALLPRLRPWRGWWPPAPSLRPQLAFSWARSALRRRFCSRCFRRPRAFWVRAIAGQRTDAVWRF
jgi:hypothetical protein